MADMKTLKTRVFIGDLRFLLCAIMRACGILSSDQDQGTQATRNRLQVSQLLSTMRNPLPAGVLPCSGLGRLE